MLLRELVKQFLPSKEIKVRLNNKQLKVNNTIVTDINTELNLDSNGVDLGEWLFNQKEALNWLTTSRMILIGNVRDLFSETSNIEELKIFSEYTLITISKQEEYVFKNL